MPRNGSGVYTLPAGNPVEPGTTIDAAWANDTLEDMANEITNSLSRTGAGGMIAPFRIADGTVTAPGMAFLNETGTGLYRSGAGSAWFSVLGVNVAQFSTVGLTIPFGKALTAQGNASVAGTFSVGGHTTLSSTLAVTGALTASGGVTGNVTGNVTAASGTSTFNDVVITGALDMTAGSSATITGLSTPTNASDAANKGYVDTQVATRLALTGGTMSGVIAMGNSKITGLATPTSDQDAATKAYVDTVAQGLDVKGSCRVGTTANITLSGTQTIDGVAVIAGDRVLVKNQSSAAENGIYVVAAGSWSRAADADTWSELVGAFTFVEEGTVNDNSGWVCTSPQGGTLGVTAVTWEQFSGAGQITAGAGLFKSGNTINVGTASSARIVVGTDDIDLATTGVTASTYKSVTVDAYGRVTAGTNPTTLAGFGITDAYTQAQVDSLVAAKLSLTGGTMSGVIAMGANKITGLSDPTNPQDAATKSYIDTIFGSTASAAASAAAAASSASAASTSATNAANSATAAAGSATSAANSYTTFNNQYLGSKTSDPSTNNSGGALVAGNLYWNSTVPEMRVYNGSAWVAAYLPATNYTFSGNVTLSAGTANGVAYLNGSKVLTTGSALTFDGGANLSTGGSNAATYNTLNVNNTASNGYSRILFNIGAGGANGLGAIKYAPGIFFAIGTDSDASSTPMTFNLNGSEQMRLTSTGLGIGTSSPQSQLDVYKATANSKVAYFSSASSFTADYGPTVVFRNGTAGEELAGLKGAFEQSSQGNYGYLSFLTRTSDAAGITEKMRLSADGNLGLGVTPSAWNSGYKALQMANNYGSISTQTGGASTLQMTWGAYATGADTWAYSTTGDTVCQYIMNSGQHRWRTAASGTAGNAISFTQAMTLDAGGRLSVVTTSPTAGGFNPTIAAKSLTDTIGGGIMVEGAGADATLNMGYDGTSMFIGSSYRTTAGYKPIAFYTSGTERARITSGGDLLVGTTSGAGSTRLYVVVNANSDAARFYGPNTSDGQHIVYFDKASGTTSTNQAFVGFTINGQTTGCGQINANGASQAAFGSFSDSRLKQNIVDLPSQLPNILSLRPVEFDYIESEGGGHQISFIAQELEEIYPDAVGERADGMKTLTGWGKTEARLVKAIQEQQAIIETLTARVAALESK